MTISELRNAVRRNLRTENLPINDIQIADFIFEAIADLSEEYDLMTKVYQMNTSRDLASYRLAPDVKRVLYVFYRPSASASFDPATGISGNVITTNQDLLSRGWNPKGVFRWVDNNRVYRADYELIDRNQLRFTPYRPPDGVITPSQMNLTTAKPSKDYVFEPFLPTTTDFYSGGSLSGLIIYEEADWVQVRPTTQSEVGVLGGKHLGVPNERYTFSTDQYEGTYRLWFQADKTGTRNLRVYTVNRFIVPNLDFFNPDEGDDMVVPQQLRYRRLIVVMTIKRILTAFMGEEAMSWINLLTAEETQLRKAIRPPMWDVAGVGGLDIIRREGGGLGG